MGCTHLHRAEGNVTTSDGVSGVVNCICGNVVPRRGEHQKYCSRLCRNRDGARRRLAVGAMPTSDRCSVCEEPIVNRGRGAIYCSSVCAGKVWRSRQQQRVVESLTRAGKLALACAVAPSLRSRNAGRKITTTDPDGRPIREITAGELSRGLLARIGVELSTDVPTTAGMRTCEVCGGAFKGALSAKACMSCRTGSCAECGAPLSQSTAVWAKKRGRPATCKPCLVKKHPPAVDGQCVDCGALVRAHTCKRAKAAGRDPLCGPCWTRRTTKPVPPCPGCGVAVNKDTAAQARQQGRDVVWHRECWLAHARSDAFKAECAERERERVKAKAARRADALNKMKTERKHGDTAPGTR